MIDIKTFFQYLTVVERIERHSVVKTFQHTHRRTTLHQVSTNRQSNDKRQVSQLEVKEEKNQ